MRALLVFALTISALAQDIPDSPDKLKYKPLEFQVPNSAPYRSQLPNGMVAYLAEDDGLPLVDLTIHFPGGSFWDPPGKEGLTDMTATLMRTAGTKTRDPKAVDEEIELLAAQVSVVFSGTTGSASLSVLSKDLDKGLELLTDILRNPAFRQDKLDLLKAQMIDRMKARNDMTGTIESREANYLLYGDFPVNRHPTKASVETIAREDLMACHQRTFSPSRMIVAAAGAFKRDAMLKKLEAAFGDWTTKPDKFEIPKVTHQPAPGIYCFHKEGKNINQGRVTMAHLGVELGHPDSAAIRVMSYILGAGGFSSRLMQRVRNDEGLAYDVRSDFRPGIEYIGTMRIEFQSKSESCAYAAKLCLEELAKMQKEGPTAKELEDAKKFYTDGFPGFFFRSKMQTMSTFATAELYRYPKDFYQTYREQIVRVTPEDVKRVAIEQIKADKFVWVVVGDIPAIKKGDGKVKLEDLGSVKDVPLRDPVTLEMPK